MKRLMGIVEALPLSFFRVTLSLTKLDSSASIVVPDEDVKIRALTDCIKGNNSNGISINLITFIFFDDERDAVLIDSK